jgi:hypothetical protein
VNGDQTTVTPVTVGAVGTTRTEIKEGLAKGDQVMLANLDAPVPTNDQSGGGSLGGPFGGQGGGPVVRRRN